MKIGTWLWIMAAAGLTASFVFSAQAAPGGAYGVKAAFTEGSPVVFPDFSVTYLGKRRVVPKQYPRGWWVYDFKIEADGKEEKISWSAGTGSIDPATFTIRGKNYQLELGLSEKLGQLKEDEMVVSKL